MFYHTHQCPCPIHPVLSTWLNNAGLSPRPWEINGFCKAPSIIESPNDLGLTQLTLWIRKGLGKSHQYYLRGGLWGTKERQEQTKNQWGWYCEGWVMCSEQCWMEGSVGYTDDAQVYRGYGAEWDKEGIVWEKAWEERSWEMARRGEVDARDGLFLSRTTSVWCETKLSV